MTETIAEPIVAKYGGTSMAEMDRVVDILENHPEQRYVVVSAASGVTDKLWLYKAHPDKRLATEIVERHIDLAQGLGSVAIAGMRDTLEMDLRKGRARTDDFIASLGEQYAAWLLAKKTDSRFIRATDIFCFDEHGMFDAAASRSRIQDRFGDNSERVVIAGYAGLDPHGKVWTLPRGGTDRSAAEVAAALGLDYENWSDVDGLYTAPPKKVPAAKIISRVALDVVREGSVTNELLMGDVVHTLLGSGRKTTIRNTFNPDASGTEIVDQLEEAEQAKLPDIEMITGADDMRKLTIQRYGASELSGWAERILYYLNGEDLPLGRRVSIPYVHSPDSRDGVSFVLREPKGPQQKRDFFYRLADIRNLIEADPLIAPSHPIEDRAVGAVYLVGSRLRGNARVRTDAFRKAVDTLAEGGVNFEETVGLSISPGFGFLLERGDVDRAIEALHKVFFEDQDQAENT